MAKDQTKFDRLLAAALTGDRLAVDRVIEDEKFSMVEYLAMPGQFNSLPVETKAELAGVYRTNPNVVPDAARPFVEGAIAGVTPVQRQQTVAKAPMGNVPNPRLRPAGASRVTPKPGPIAAALTSAGRRLMGMPGKSTGGVDPRLVRVLTAAAADFNLPVVVKSAMRGGDRRQHGKGRAVDINIIGRDGKVIPDYQDGNGFRAYEQFAQLVRTKQQQMYPELDNALRWGGYFGGKNNYGAMDSMHFDLGGLQGLGMMGGSWEGGLNARQRSYYPSAVSIGMGDVDMIRLNKLGYVGPDAVERYQADRGLEVDGVIGKNTRGMLLTDISAPIPPADIPNAGQRPVGDPALGARAASELQGYDGKAVIPAKPEDAPTVVDETAKAPKPNLRPASDISAVAERVLTRNGRLRKGASGDDVRQLQSFLNRRGVRDDKGRPVAVDGRFGRLTRQAVENYQAGRPELRQDGVIGPRTLAAMLRDAQAEQAPYRQGMEGSPELASATPSGDPLTAVVQAAATGVIPATPGAGGIPGLAPNPFGQAVPPVSAAAWGIGANLADAMGGLGAYPKIRYLAARQGHAEITGGAPLQSRPADEDDLSFAAPLEGPARSLAFINPDLLEAENELFTPYDGASVGRSLGAVTPNGSTVNNTGAALYNATSAFARSMQTQKQNQRKQENAAYQAYKAQPSPVFGELTPEEFDYQYRSTSDSDSSKYYTTQKPGGAKVQPGSSSGGGYTNPTKSNTTKSNTTTPKAQPSTSTKNNTQKTGATKASPTSSLRTDAAGRVLGGI